MGANRVTYKIKANCTHTGAIVFLFEGVMSKNVKNSRVIRVGVLGALSMAVLSGCQSTGQHTGGLTKTGEVNLMQYTTHTSYGVDHDEEISFELPLADIVECPMGWSELVNGKPFEGKTGTLTITKVEKDMHSLIGEGFIYGYVSTDQYDVSKCRATIQFRESEYKRPYVSKSYLNVIAPRLKELTQQSKDAEAKANLERIKQLEAKANETWHIRELNNTAKGIAMIKVCMEKGTYFLSIDKGAQKVIRDSESYARNDIRSKVSNKHYFDEAAYKTAYQKEMQTSRFLWEHDYVAFTEQCATMRNIVDSYINQ